MAKSSGFVFLGMCFLLAGCTVSRFYKTDQDIFKVLQGVWTNTYLSESTSDLYKEMEGQQYFEFLADSTLIPYYYVDGARTDAMPLKYYVKKKVLYIGQDSAEYIPIRLRRLMSYKMTWKFELEGKQLTMRFEKGEIQSDRPPPSIKSLK